MISTFLAHWPHVPCPLPAFNRSCCYHCKWYNATRQWNPQLCITIYSNFVCYIYIYMKRSVRIWKSVSVLLLQCLSFSFNKCSFTISLIRDSLWSRVLHLHDSKEPLLRWENKGVCCARRKKCPFDGFTLARVSGVFLSGRSGRRRKICAIKRLFYNRPLEQSRAPSSLNSPPVLWVYPRGRVRGFAGTYMRMHKCLRVCEWGRGIQLRVERNWESTSSFPKSCSPCRERDAGQDTNVRLYERDAPEVHHRQRRVSPSTNKAGKVCVYIIPIWILAWGPQWRTLTIQLRCST